MKCCILNMSANLESSAVATGLENVSFHSNSKRRAAPKNVQTIVQLCSFHMLARCNAQNPSSQASTVHGPRTFRCTSWIYKGRETRDQTANKLDSLLKSRDIILTTKVCTAKAMVFPAVVQM